MKDDEKDEFDREWERAYAFDLPPLLKLTADVIESVKTMPKGEVRYLCDLYLRMLDFRKRTGQQRAALIRDEKPFELIDSYFKQFDRLVITIRRCMDSYSDMFEASRWAKRQYGVAEVIAAGLQAHVDITRCPTVGHLWRFAGVDPTTRREKGKKLQWNARLKTLVWHAGRSFMFRHNHPQCYYGKIYENRKLLEVQRNEEGLLAEQATQALATKKITRQPAKSIYESGKLPPAHLDARARRYAAKMFLSHWHEVAYRAHYGEPPPACFAIAQLGHGHYIPPPP